jgi:hypothetical protein
MLPFILREVSGVQWIEMQRRFAIGKINNSPAFIPILAAKTMILW